MVPEHPALLGAGGSPKLIKEIFRFHVLVLLLLSLMNLNILQKAILQEGWQQFIAHVHYA